MICIPSVAFDSQRPVTKRKSLTFRPRGWPKIRCFFLRSAISTCGPAHDSARHPPIPQHPQDFHLNSAGPVDIHIRLCLAHCSRNHSFGKLYYIILVVSYQTQQLYNMQPPVNFSQQGVLIIRIIERIAKIPANLERKDCCHCINELISILHTS